MRMTTARGFALKHHEAPGHDITNDSCVGRDHRFRRHEFTGGTDHDSGTTQKPELIRYRHVSVCEKNHGGKSIGSKEAKADFGETCCRCAEGAIFGPLMKGETQIG